MNKRETKKLINRLARIAVAVGWEVRGWDEGGDRAFYDDPNNNKLSYGVSDTGKGVVEVTHRLKCAVEDQERIGITVSSASVTTSKPTVSVGIFEGLGFEPFDPLSCCDAISRVMAEIVGVRV